MKYCNLINFSFKNLKRDKKNILNIILISFAFALIILCFSIQESLYNYWDSSVKKLVDYRTYVVSFNKKKYNSNEAIKKLKKINHIVEAFDEKSYLISMKVNDKKITSENNGIFLIGTIPEPIKLVLGNKLTSNNNENQIICAKQFYPYTEYNQKDYLLSKSMDITDKLGKNLSLSFITSNNVELFKIVGLYDAKENHTEGNICYTTPDVVAKLNNKYQADIFSGDKNFVYMVIDNIDNKELVSKELKKVGFKLENATLNINKDMGNKIINLMFLISGIIVFLTIILIIFLSSKRFYKRKRDYLIMKTSGYSNIQIMFTYTFELLLSFIVAFILSILIYKLILICFNNIYISNKLVFYGLKLKLSYKPLYINIILSIMICVVMSFYFISRIIKIPIKSMVK